MSMAAQAESAALTNRRILRGIKNAQTRERIRTLVAKGWTLSQTGKGHVRVDPPNGGRPVFSALSSGDWRDYQNFRAAVRRAWPELGID